jgi:putative ABC transport system permease protein
MSGWRPALRVARRSVRRHLGRSLLVIAMIALPVAGATLADGLVHAVTDRAVDRDRVMGTADARVNIEGRKPFDVMPLLPPGSRAVPLSASYFTGSLRLAAGDRVVRTRLDMVTVGDPLTAHLARLSSGRLPRGPGEVLVTRPLADRLGILDGDTVRPAATATTVNGQSVTVTGLAVKPYCLSCSSVVAPRGSRIEQAMLDGSPLPVGYLVDLPAGVDVAALARAWPMDSSRIITRDSYADTTLVSAYLLQATGYPLGLFAGFGLLGIVLMAGAAFAVGARQQVRELGLVAASGGTAKHIRRIVLAQGLVLGVLGAACGLLLGALAIVLGMPLWQRVTDQLLENVRFGWGELAAAAGVGVLASVVAAAVPAFGVARMRPVDALAGRFRAVAPTARWPGLGVLLVALGVACVVAAGALGRSRLAEGTTWIGRQPQLPIAGTLVGALVAAVGLLMVVPALVAAVSRLRLPLSGRLATRDAVRHRHRTVGAVAAVMITVASSVATAFVFTAQANSELKTLPDNMVLAQLDPVAKYVDGADGERELDRAMTGMTAAVPGAVARKVTFVTDTPAGPGSGPIFFAPVESTCRNTYNPQYNPQLGIGSPDMVELVSGRRPDARLRSALAEGRVVVFDDCVVSSSGTVRIEFNIDEPVELPAYVAEWPANAEYDGRYLPGAFISAKAAAARGWSPYADSVAVTYPDSADVDTLRAAAENAGVDTVIQDTTGDQITGLYLVLAGIAGLVALLGSGVTVALSAAAGRTDLATLAALGAQPRRRRTLAGAQALVVSGLGTLAGLVLGGSVGYAAVPISGLLGAAVPWRLLWLTAVAVPLLAAAVAVVVTPSRLPMIQRRQS